ncbi:TauD/TfdA family dioxygenase [Stenotrophomonas sp. 57]|uniref:TauD/TfdA family dioxygenase n=1 Tax=Stenotrophomonas sp. 57 TaxID=3051119 RepID=UPI00256EED07|nr:TauD/TfdA family dioxygenase [Stenotrophomonas sp. 57]
MDVGIAHALRDSVAEFCKENADTLSMAVLDPIVAGQAICAKLAQRIDCAVAAAQIKEDLEQNGVALFKGVFVPGEDLPETPSAFVPVPMTGTTAALQLCVIGANALIGKLTVSYGSENDGNLFVNLVGMGGDGQTAFKSQKHMRGHTDAMSFPFPGEKDPHYPGVAPSPDLVCLGALRNPDGVPTTIMPLAKILEDLDEGVIKELMQRKFTVVCQETFKDGTIAKLGVRHSVRGAAVIRDTVNAERWVRFSHTKVTADEDDQVGMDALEAFKSAVASHVQSVPLEPGDILLVSNRRALHGRSKVGDAKGGKSRWLVRSYALDGRHAQAYLIQGSSFCLFP